MPRPTCEVVLGDARLRLRAADRTRFGLIVLDAFSSDAMPVHLLTREALRLYRDKLADGGLVAFTITNGYLDLEPVLGNLAARRRDDLPGPLRRRALAARRQRRGKQPSIWAVLADRPEASGRSRRSSLDTGPDAGRRQPFWRDSVRTI